jgi:hypothetical protein
VFVGLPFFPRRLSWSGSATSTRQEPKERDNIDKTKSNSQPKYTGSKRAPNNARGEGLEARHHCAETHTCELSCTNGEGSKIKRELGGQQQPKNRRANKSSENRLASKQQTMSAGCTRLQKRKNKLVRVNWVRGKIEEDTEEVHYASGGGTFGSRS